MILFMIFSDSIIILQKNECLLVVRWWAALERKENPTVFTSHDRGARFIRRVESEKEDRRV